VDASRTATINSVISGLSGTGGITKTGDGTLNLAATNTYTGSTTVNAGHVNVTGSLANNGAAKIFMAVDTDGNATFDGAKLTRNVATLGNSYAGHRLDQRRWDRNGRIAARGNEHGRWDRHGGDDVAHADHRRGAGRGRDAGRDRRRVGPERDDHGGSSTDAFAMQMDYTDAAVGGTAAETSLLAASTCTWVGRADRCG
jgi:autotransporter-associated beta strand protein